MQAPVAQAIRPPGCSCGRVAPSLNQPVTNVESPNATPPQPVHRGAQMAKPASARAPRGCRGAQRQGGHAQRASSSGWPELFERSAPRARSEFEGPTLPRAPQGSHAAGMTTRLAPETMPAQRRPALPRQSAPPHARQDKNKKAPPTRQGLLTSRRPKSPRNHQNNQNGFITMSARPGWFGRSSGPGIGSFERQGKLSRSRRKKLSSITDGIGTPSTSTTPA